MKWEIIDNSPRPGDIRFKTRFAWWPTRVLSKLTNTDHMVWLALYIEEQEYVRPYGCFEYDWVTVSRTIHV